MILLSKRRIGWIVIVVVMTIVIAGVRISLIGNGFPPPAMESFIPSDTGSPQQSFAMLSSTLPPSPLKRNRKDWWEPYVDVISVIYQPSNQTKWCEQIATSAHQKKTNNILTGMYLVKMPKTASSTSAAVALQIAESIALRKGLTKPCPTHVRHGSSYKSRQDPSFLWTVVRQPHKRDISEYFHFEISRRGEKYDSKDLIRHLEEKKNNQFKYISQGMESYPLLVNTSQSTNKQLHALERLSSVFQTYDFIAVTERMEESLVVMKLLHQFPDESIVVLNSKTSGGFDDGKYKQTCYKIQKSYTTEEVDHYIAKDYQKDNLDFLLYTVANRSLDKTIEFLGQERVKKEVMRHRKLHQLAEDLCLKKAVYPCTKHGKPNRKSAQSCYFGDVGCGHKCVMDVIRNATKDETNV